MEWIFNQLRERPELAIFLTIFLGFWLGKLRIGKFTLGTVTSVLLVGVSFLPWAIKWVPSSSAD